MFRTIDSIILRIFMTIIGSVIPQSTSWMETKGDSSDSYVHTKTEVSSSVGASLPKARRLVESIEVWPRLEEPITRQIRCVFITSCRLLVRSDLPLSCPALTIVMIVVDCNSALTVLPDHLVGRHDLVRCYYAFGALDTVDSSLLLRIWQSSQPGRSEPRTQKVLPSPSMTIGYHNVCGAGGWDGR